MAKKAKISIYDWLVNDNPRNEGCSMCFYNGDCNECYEIVKNNKSLYDMFSVNRYIFDNIISEIYTKDNNDLGITVIDIIHDLIEGAKNVNGDDSRGDRGPVRKKSKKNKKKVNVRGKRDRRRKAKKDVEEHGEEETSQKDNENAKEE